MMNQFSCSTFQAQPQCQLIQGKGLTMNAVDKLKRGHEIVLQTTEAFPEVSIETPDACGVWSVKDIIAHLLSYEHVIIDVLNTFVSGSATPNLDRLWAMGSQFNESEVSRYKTKPLQDILTEFNTAHTRSVSIAVQIPGEKFSQKNSLPWYGGEYDLDDFIVEHCYGHKREHSAQIAAFGGLMRGEVSLSQDALTATTIKITELLEDAINRRDVDAVMALFADDCVFENTSPPPDGERLEGQQAIRAFWENLFRSTSHVDFQTEDMFAHANQCVARWTYQWENMAGECGHIRGIDVIDVRNGKVAKNFSYVRG